MSNKRVGMKKGGRRLRKGSPPSFSDGWVLWEEESVRGNDWDVYARFNADRKWSDFKVVAKRQAETKANYLLSVSHECGRLAKGKDHMLLKEHREALYDRVTLLALDFAKDCRRKQLAAKEQRRQERAREKELRRRGKL